ncbi:restriction endonuclease [Sulfurospirillum multivorans]|uniref:Mrr restriction system protein n=2 Tax=Sulfurospirillum multivorans TaxID=66821 RepID=A0AA86APR8_SULMK|nr:restriction endonuclease [Sulfurospirillum multivorans]AHJ13537.1 Mrr restriction system protein [Sulfurospirillum multivorans DSM 12446]QEH07027.1 Mrr restriction system protein [Sulfurospirillum multivorans]
MFKYSYNQLFEPTIHSLKQLGGSGSIDEIEEKVIEILHLTEAEINDIHRGNTTKLEYRLAWARTYLKRYGLLDNSARGIWALTEKGFKDQKIDDLEIRQFVSKAVKSLSHCKSQDLQQDIQNEEDILELELGDEVSELTWQEELLDILKKIHPQAFERLCQRFLRELGFINVEVTQYSNDGGIDGKGVIRLGGVMSFHVVFQAKRYKDSVSASIVRDFRGAMIGRADKGVIITTGTFTREAKKEAQRDGAPPIDLIDGNDFVSKLRELNLGINIELVEKVNVNKEWFENF